MKNIVVLTSLVFLFALNVQAQSQAVVAKDTPQLVVAKIKTASMLLTLCSSVPENEKCKDVDPRKDLMELQSSCIKDSECSSMLIADAIANYESLRFGARSAVQVSQAADEYGVKMQLILLSQNQRIIELLEQLVKKR